MPLKNTRYNALRINLKKCDVFLAVVGRGNVRSGRVTVPPEWVDKKVYVVLKDE
jgi:putative transposon-encoded protein